MAQKKYQVFVSSTFRDLVDERQDAIRNILDLKHIPAGMELFPAADVDQLEYIKKVIDECDYYLLIVGGRYGSMDSNGVSYTEREYDYAVETGKLVIAFVHSDPASIPVGRSDIDSAAIDALNAFRAKVMDGRLVKSWQNRQELEGLVLKSLIHAFSDYPQVGWVRGDSLASDDLLVSANIALQENADLRKEIADLRSQVQPKIVGLAGLDDTFPVRYESRWASSRTSSPTYTPRTIELTWLQMFLPLAGFLNQSKTDGVILRAIQEAAEEIDHEYKPYRLNETDKFKIKAQFEALGLISCRVSKTTQGGVAEFLTLTQKGRAVFLENITVRK